MVSLLIRKYASIRDKVDIWIGKYNILEIIDIEYYEGDIYFA